MQILSLHNSTKLRSRALSAVAESCPQLQMLMLGGCSLALTPAAPSSSMTMVMLWTHASLLLCLCKLCGKHIGCVNVDPHQAHKTLMQTFNDHMARRLPGQGMPLITCLPSADWRGNEADDS